MPITKTSKGCTTTPKTNWTLKMITAVKFSMMSQVVSGYTITVGPAYFLFTMTLLMRLQNTYVRRFLIILIFPSSMVLLPNFNDCTNITSAFVIRFTKMFALVIYIFIPCHPKKLPSVVPRWPRWKFSCRWKKNWRSWLQRIWQSLCNRDR